MERIERFCKTTRWFHWSFVLSFLGLAGTGAVLGLREQLALSEDATRNLVHAHETLAAIWLLAPPLVLASGQTRRAFADLTLPFRINAADLRWLALQPLALLGRAELPPAGKLNGGQKLNGVLVAVLSLGLAGTGLWLWRRPAALLPWFVHLTLFAVWLPAFAGHFYLAVLNPGTRHALRAMLNGHVDLAWARHHHPLWVESLRGSAGSPPSQVPAARPRPLATGALADEQA
jgi:formate dehydrogenase subunit gamma